VSVLLLMALPARSAAHSFPTRRSSDLVGDTPRARPPRPPRPRPPRCPPRPPASSRTPGAGAVDRPPRARAGSGPVRLRRRRDLRTVSSSSSLVLPVDAVGEADPDPKPAGRPRPDLALAVVGAHPLAHAQQAQPGSRRPRPGAALVEHLDL